MKDKEKRGAFPGAKTRRGVVTSEASPRLAREIGGRVPVWLRGMALRVCPQQASSVTVQPSTRSQVLPCATGIQAAVIPHQRRKPATEVAGYTPAPCLTPPSSPPLSSPIVPAVPPRSSSFPPLRLFASQSLSQLFSLRQLRAAIPFGPSPTAFSVQG